MTQLDVFAQQSPSEAFARRFAAQPGFQGFGSLNPIQNQAFNALGTQAVNQLPFGQAFSLFGQGGLLPQFQGLGGAELAQSVPSRDTAFDQFLGPGRADASTLSDRLSSGVAQLNANRPSVFGTQGAGALSPALALLAGELGGDPERAASLSIAPFIAGLPPSLRGGFERSLLGRFGDFSAVNPETNFLDVFNRFQNAGFF